MSKRVVLKNIGDVPNGYELLDTPVGMNCWRQTATRWHLTLWRKSSRRWIMITTSIAIMMITTMIGGVIARTT